MVKRTPTPLVPAIHTGDWAWAQSQYELGKLPPAAVAREIGVSVGRLTGQAQRAGWVKDPLAAARVAAENRAILTAQAEVERGRIERITAQMQSKVLVSHRQDIKQARLLAQSLLTELSAVTVNIELFDDLGEALRSEDDRGRDKLNDIYQRVISLPQRSQTLSSLAQTLKVLILLERQAFGIEGLLEDPEATRPSHEVTKGLDAIMDKFNQVLALQAPQGQEPRTEIVIDVSQPAQRSA